MPRPRKRARTFSTNDADAPVSAASFRIDSSSVTLRDLMTSRPFSPRPPRCTVNRVSVKQRGRSRRFQGPAPGPPKSRLFAGPIDDVGSHRTLESLEGHFPQILEGQALSEAQVGNRARDQNLLGLGVGTEPCRELNRRAEEV